MALYRYTDQSLIDEVHIRKDKAGREVRAYLHARDGVSAEELTTVAQRLNKAGFITTPYDLDGTPMLEVRNFRKGDNLISILKNAGAIGAHTGKESQDGDKASAKDKIRKATLQAAGAAYYVGDIAFFTYGVRDKNPYTIAGALGYFAGTNILAWFGGADQSCYQVKDAAKKMQHFLIHEQVPAEDIATLQEATKDRSRNLWQKFKNTCRKYPSEVFSFIYVFTGLFIAWSTRGELKEFAEKKVEFKKMLDTGQAGGHSLSSQELDFLKDQLDHTIPHNTKAKYLDIGLGSMTTAASLFPLLVKEKARDESEPKRKGLAGVWDWIRERPLKIQGIGYLISTLCHTGSTYVEMREAGRTINMYKDVEHYITGHAPKTRIEFKPNTLPVPTPHSPIQNPTLLKTMGEAVQGAKDKKESLIGRAIFVLANLFAEVMIYLSSKGHGEGVKSDDSVEKSVTALAAASIAKQPAERQAVLVERLAGFLASPEVMGGKPENIAANIRCQLAAMKNNPWASAASPASAVAQETAQEPAPAIAAAPERAGKPWEQRINEQQTITAAPQLGG